MTRRRTLFLALAVAFAAVPFVLKGALLHFPNSTLTRVVVAPLVAGVRPRDNALVVGSVLVPAVSWVAYFVDRERAACVKTSGS